MTSLKVHYIYKRCMKIKIWDIYAKIGEENTRHEKEMGKERLVKRNDYDNSVIEYCKNEVI